MTRSQTATGAGTRPVMKSTSLFARLFYTAPIPEQSRQLIGGHLRGHLFVVSDG